MLHTGGSSPQSKLPDLGSGANELIIGSAQHAYFLLPCRHVVYSDKEDFTFDVCTRCGGLVSEFYKIEL